MMKIASNTLFARSMKITLATFVFIVGTQASAYKEVRGGNGVGGTLRDRYSHGETQRLDGAALYEILRAKFKSQLSRFPLVDEAARALYFGATAKAVYSDSRELHPDCLNGSTVGGRAEIWACQNDVEIRISKSFWDANSDSLKADLLLHELITALFFKKENEGAIEPAVIAFLDGKLSVKQIKAEFWRLGFKNLYSETQVAQVQASLFAFSKVVCLKPEGQARDLVLLDFTLELSKTNDFEAAALFEAAARAHMKELLPWAESPCLPLDSYRSLDLLFRTWNPL